MAADEGLRKLSAILAADVMGYSRLMADDERATVRTLTEYREVFSDLVERHMGRIIDTAGDSVLATFDSVVEAVEAAVAVQRELKERNETLADHRRMWFRIGVNLGDIIVREDGTVYGDGVNVAARLEALAEPGGVMISDFARQGVGSKIGVSFKDAGAHTIKNIPEAVRAFRVWPDGVAESAAIHSKSRLIVRTKVIPAAVVVAAILIGLAVWGVTVKVETPQMVMADGTPTDDPVLAMPQGPTIAISAFETLSGGQEQELFAKGLVKDLTVALSKFRDIRIVTDQESANYVLTGSVRRTPDRLRLVAEVIDKRSDTNVWSESFDRSLTADSIYDVQDTIIAKVASLVGGQSGIIARDFVADRDGHRSTSMAAYDCVLLVYEYDRALSEEKNREARSCLEGVLAKDPDNADALSALSFMYEEASLYGFFDTDDDTDYLAEALRMAKRASELEPNDADSRRHLALAHYYMGDLAKFREQAERALDLNPNDPTILGQLGTYLTFIGDVERGTTLVRKAFALNPDLPSWFKLSFTMEHYLRKEWAEGADLVATFAGADEKYHPIVWQVMFHGELGNTDQADQAFDALLQIVPEFSIEYYLKDWGNWHVMERMLHAGAGSLRKAGVPEKSQPNAPDRPVIAVLPFDNMSDDPGQEYFADGITEDLITRLSKIPEFRVIGRNTTFQFKGKAVDVQEVARELGASYVLEGSVRRSADTLRLTAQLLDGKEGTHVWAETYDRQLDVANIFSVQDSIAEMVVSRIGDPLGEIARNEFRQVGTQRPANLSSYECLLLWYRFYVEFTYDLYLAMQDCAQQAVKEDPNYAWGWGILGVLKEQEVAIWAEIPHSEGLEDAIPLLENAIRLAPDEGLLRIWFARILILSDHMSRGRDQLEAGLALDPNNATLLGEAADVFTFFGDFERAVQLMDRMKELNPNYSPWLNFVYAKWHVINGDFNKATIALLNTQMEEYFWMQAGVAAGYCLQGDLEKGRAHFERALELQPNIWEIGPAAAVFWNKGDRTKPWVDFYNDGISACGFEAPGSSDGEDSTLLQ